MTAGWDATAPSGSSVCLGMAWDLFSSRAPGRGAAAHLGLAPRACRCHRRHRGPGAGPGQRPGDGRGGPAALGEDRVPAAAGTPPPGRAGRRVSPRRPGLDAPPGDVIGRVRAALRPGPFVAAIWAGPATRRHPRPRAPCRGGLPPRPSLVFPTPAIRHPAEAGGFRVALMSFTGHPVAAARRPGRRFAMSAVV